MKHTKLTFCAAFLLIFHSHQVWAQNPKAVISISYNTICLGTAFTFDGLKSTGADSYEWEFIGKNFKSQDSVFHYKPKAIGTWAVSLTVQNGNGSSTVFDTVEVVKIPEVFAGDYDSICINHQPILLNKQVVMSDSKGMGFWVYHGVSGKDSIPLKSNVIDPTKYGVVEEPDYHRFSYHFTINGSDCSVSDHTKFRINKTTNPEITHTWPVSQKDFNKICVDDELNLTGSQSEDGINYVSWKFSGDDVKDLGNGKFKFTAKLKQNPLEALEKTITYSTTNYFGCTGTITEKVIVEPKNYANFNLEINKKSAHFKNASTGSNLYLWDFGDGNVSRSKNPSHVFSDTGTYTVRLTSSRESGACPVAWVEKEVSTWPLNAKTVKALSTKIYPNPTRKILNLNTNFNIVSIKIYNCTGQLLIEQRAASQSAFVDVESLLEGQYILEVSGENEILKTQFVK